MTPSGKRNSTNPGAGNTRLVHRVWRITESAPGGEFVDSAPSGASPSQPGDHPDPVVPGWAMSSFELMTGLDVSEDPETVPADLFDKLFKR